MGDELFDQCCGKTHGDHFLHQSLLPMKHHELTAKWHHTLCISQNSTQRHILSLSRCHTMAMRFCSATEILQLRKASTTLTFPTTETFDGLARQATYHQGFIFWAVASLSKPLPPALLRIRTLLQFPLDCIPTVAQPGDESCIWSSGLRSAPHYPCETPIQVGRNELRSAASPS